METMKTIEKLESLLTAQTDTGHGAIKLTRTQVKDAWGMGLFNDAAYIWLAVQFMRSEGGSFTLDPNEFCDIWCQELAPGKYKRLKPETVRGAISKWQAKGAVKMPETTIQLEILF